MELEVDRGESAVGDMQLPKILASTRYMGFATTSPPNDDDRGTGSGGEPARRTLVIEYQSPRR
jgi:hypothetical protein